MKAHITTKCKPCPFCGARADEIESITGMDLIACSNYNGCGAIVSIEFKCSNCEGIISTDWDGIEDFGYCSYCGARTGDSV